MSIGTARVFGRSSGSANLLLLRQVSESLAGRAAYLELLPFASGEWAGAPAPVLLHDLLDGQATVHRHLSLLDVSYLYRPVPAFIENRGKRLAKRPKAYLADPGLAARPPG